MGVNVPENSFPGKKLLCVELSLLGAEMHGNKMYSIGTVAKPL